MAGRRRPLLRPKAFPGSQGVRGSQRPTSPAHGRVRKSFGEYVDYVASSTKRTGGSSGSGRSNRAGGIFGQSGQGVKNATTTYGAVGRAVGGKSKRMSRRTAR